MKYGYARVSSTDQDLTIQREALEAAGCETIREEKRSGTTREGRTELKLLLDFARAGDTLVVTRIDRLARSMIDFQAIMGTLREKGVQLECTEQSVLNSSGAIDKLMIDVLAAFAEFETNLRKERQMEGIAKAKSNGVYRGSKRRFEPHRIKDMHSQGVGPAAISRELGCSQMTVYRALKD